MTNAIVQLEFDTQEEQSPIFSHREVAIRAAAFIEAEGCICISSAKQNYAVRVRVTSTNRAIVDWFYWIYGGAIYRKPIYGNRSQAWDWCVAATSAEKVLRDILPFAMIKREQIVCALELRSLQGRKTGYMPIQEKIATWQPYHDRMKRLNERGAERHDHQD